MIHGAPTLDLTERRVLVTGAGGFLGRHLCAHLLAQGARVHGTWLHRPVPDGTVGWHVDLRRARAWREVFAQVAPELVYHLAAPVDLSRDPRRFGRLQAGILGATQHVAESCLSAGTRLVATCTCEVYGDQEAPFSEDLPPRPVSAYSCLKAAATAWLLTLARQEGLKVTVVRPFLTFGPGQAERFLIPSAIRAALQDRAFPLTSGTQTREVNFVADTVRGIALGAVDAAVGGLFNIGGGPEIPVLDLARRIYTLCGRDPGRVRPGALAPRKGEARRFFGDHARAREVLGHVPGVGLDAGLRASIEACHVR